MENIRAFLAELSRELQRGEDFDIEARQILEQLNADADRLEASGGKDIESMHERVKELESKFAANHPVLERLARELADALAKMGI